MDRKAGLCATIVVVISSLLWLLLVTGIVTRPVQAYRGSAVSVEDAATVSSQATPTQALSTKGLPTQQGTSVQNEQVPSWVMLILLLISCAILLALLSFVLWIGGLVPWHRKSQPAGWRYEVLLALLAALAALIALAVQFLAAFTPPIWVRIVLFIPAGALVLAVPVVRLRSTQLEKERTWARQVRGLLQVPLGANSQLPRLSALSPYRLGVSPSKYGSEKRRGDDPYVSRVTDDELDQTLRNERFVLVVGDSKAGKSRTAYEAAARLRQAGQSHDPRVLVPKRTEVLEQLLELDPPLALDPEPALLWLDNLTESALEALTPALLDRLTAQMIVLGTMTAQRFALVTGSDSEITRDAKQALRRATRIDLEAVLIPEERVKAEQKYPKEQFKAGIGEQLVAVDELTSRYVMAHMGANHHGWAIVQAAIDWTRINVGRPISKRELVALCPLYLDQLRAHATHDDTDHEEALHWACQPVASHIALLQELPSDRDEPSYVPFDYLVDAADGQDERLTRAILDPAWDKVLALVLPVSPSEALSTGFGAYFRKIPHRPQQIFTAVAAGDTEEAAWARLTLGLLLREQDDVEGAKAAYQRAIDSGHAKPASDAAFNLGVLLAEQGDLPEAKAAYQQAIDSDQADWAPRAAFNLGVLLQKQGDLSEAKVAYQQAIKSGHVDWAPRAAYNLGLLVHEQGDVEGARALYQQAIDSGDPEAAPLAAFHLGRLLAKQGDVEGAMTAYRQAIASGHAVAAPVAAKNLGLLKSTPPPADS